MMPTCRLALALLLTACTSAQPGVRLRSHPSTVAINVVTSGVINLKLRAPRDTLFYVPASAPETAPLVLYLHGATGDEQEGIRRLSALADEFGFLLVSPASGGETWDAIRTGFGPDVRMIDQALSRVFAQRRVDRRKIAICGFSDGASYALGLGISNGDLFHAIIAFSPGFIPDGVKRTGDPRIFISHGTEDQILPFEGSSQRLAPGLKRIGYSVKFEQFSGPHRVPPEIAREAIGWFMGDQVGAPR